MQDQLDEIEALSCIFFDEFFPSDDGYIVLLKPNESGFEGLDHESEEFVRANWIFNLHVKYPSDYPPSLPELSVDKKDYIDHPYSPCDLDLLEYTMSQANELIPNGVIMFDLITALQSFLANLILIRTEQIRRELEWKNAVDESKFIGTKVTRDSFLKWRDEFYVKVSKEQKVTGKQLFEAGQSFED